MATSIVTLGRVERATQAPVVKFNRWAFPYVSQSFTQVVPPGTTITVPDDEAAYLIAQGAARLA